MQMEVANRVRRGHHPGPMRYAAAIAHFKTVKAIAKACGGINTQAVYQWQKSGIVPQLRAYQLQAKSGGKLKVEESLYACLADEPTGASS